jgi:2-oxoglutarate ferredoxin oxidoreductase subunit beta
MTGRIELTVKDWNTATKATWCPGCGDHGVLSATKRAIVELGWKREDTVVVSGIGCSSNFPHFINAYGVHSLHGRAVPTGQGVKMTNPDLNVIIAGGDGDGLAIGTGGFIHAARRNMNITYIIMNNQVYGLTVNQTSPTSSLGRLTTSTPFGNIEPPMNPVALAIAAGATFVARTFSGDSKHAREVMKQALDHKGFAFVDALSPCVTFNRFNTNEWFKERVYRLEDTDFTPEDYLKSYTQALEFGDKIPLGVFYKTDQPTYESQDYTLKKFGSPVKRGAQRITQEALDAIYEEVK